MTDPRVTVIVPVRDAGRDLARALRSVEAQTVSGYEVVVADDGSCDPATLTAIAAAARRPEVRVVRHDTPRGPAAARNLAVAHARAPLLLPLDADDWLAPEFLRRTLAVLEAAPAVDVVHTWVGLAGSHRGVWRTGPLALPALLARCTVHVTALLRRSVWDRVGGWDERFRDGAEDWDFWIGAAASGTQAVVVPEILCHYWRGSQSRERRARAPGTSRRLVRQLVTKHRPLYLAHLDDVIPLLYEEYARVCDSLEQLYAHPGFRAALRLRELFRSLGPHA